MNKNINVSLLVICGTILVSFFLFSRTGVFIKQIGGVESDGKISNTISVSGDGKVYAKPDMAEISLSFSEMAATSREAMDKVNGKIAQAIKVAKDNGIADNDISTTGLNIYTDYDYNSPVRKIIGQRATQSLAVKVKKLDEKATKAAKLIDELSTIDNVQFSGIGFNIEDKTKFYSQARELAFEKAKQKATELAKLAGVRLGKPVSITDATYDYSPGRQYSNVAEMKMADSVGNSSQVPSGEMSISTELSILWGIE